MQERVVKEIALLTESFPSLQHGAWYDWVVIPDFPLPRGYNRQSTQLLFVIPAAYPHTAPDCFYVDVGLRLSDGAIMSNYNEEQEVPIGGQWGYFSWHPEVWQPQDEILAGDNLLTFIRAVNLRLREAN